MQITEALGNLGLNEKEARVYVALLQIGRGSAYAVAEKAGLKRPTTYVILGELMQKGLVLKVPRARKQMFIAKSPEEFFMEAEERLRMAKAMLPQLVAMSDKEGKQFKTLYYEGMKGTREMYKEINSRMKGKEVLGFYGKVSGKMPSELDEYFHELNEIRKRIGITMRGMTPDDPSLTWYRERLSYFGHSFKYLALKDYSGDASVEIGDDFIQIYSLNYLQGVHIENPDIAHTMRQIFEMVWSSRPEPITGKVDPVRSSG
ncbi:MAG: Transcriptional regulator, TrmB [Parcubacteria group bacterium GW2011_GWB1_52_7]|nr:MAG: Transcriptional regulator, TrmB [Parcubacteria group bacterium GW2011_GWA1_51_12]KKW29211.1 MAG: Transcriptional regulator, TrmB [Parcubacteria group bacterium GW2011_GWB1_52_7]KKW30467.1 MAG: Transcriptional regulator, TrmB [Parcubacteria group bacterium GW2011_GWC2_52_8c]